MSRPRILTFDSGLGGLTVFREIAKLIPEADHVYAADDAGFPYGDWAADDLVWRVVAVMRRLIADFEPQAVCIACNTASTLVLPHLRAAFPDLPFVGTVPAVKPAAGRSRSQMISVLATPGTVARDGATIVEGPRRPLADLNTLPAHDYGLLDVPRYFAAKGKRQLDYISSQGCRFRCAFCADPAVFSRAWTGLAPERVAAELQHLHERHGVEDVAFQDETFFTSSARVATLARELLARQVRVQWTATLRADQACRLGDEAMALAVRAGFRRAMIGVESGSQATLDRLQKDVSLPQVRQAAEMLVRHGVGGIFNFIVGFPGEPVSSIGATLELAKTIRRMSPDFDTPVFYYRPYPGNPLADRAAADGFAFPRGLEAWADFDYVGGRGPWIAPEVWRTVEAFKFYVRHAWRPGPWRWPLRVASRVRCDLDFYRWPIEKHLVELVRPPQQVS
jgi:radical SAM superfamily enzyme YgiQ (UPF0313 family)